MEPCGQHGHLKRFLLVAGVWHPLMRGLWRFHDEDITVPECRAPMRCFQAVVSNFNVFQICLVLLIVDNMSTKHACRHVWKSGVQGRKLVTW